MSEAVTVSGLKKNFNDIVAVDDVSFSVGQGEVLGFLGPNGAGKSTTMKIVTGFLAPDAGTVSICGENIAANPIAAKSAVGYLPEGAPLYADMTPVDFLDFIARMRGLRGASAEQAVDNVVQRINLGSVVDQPIDTLSKGFKRRVGLAQAILHDPRVLVLDEPTDGLDPNQKFEVRKLIRELAAEKVIILSTHILEEVEAVCSRALVIAAGKVVADAKPDELAAKSVLHNSVVLQVSGADAGTLRQTLSSIPNINSVEPLPGDIDGRSQTFRLYPVNGENIMPGVTETLRNTDWQIQEIKLEQGRLDDVFRDLTMTEQKIS